MSDQTQTMKIRGLYTNSNELSEAPDGALKVADNIWISKDSIAESRRGFDFLPFRLPNAADRADKLSQFQGDAIIHYNNTATTNLNDSLAYYDVGTGVHTYAGAYAHPDPLLARMKFAEANKNFYFTTAKGVFKIDTVTTAPVLSGMYKALDVTASPSANASGFMADNTEVAYRIVWGKKDANMNLILGSPSQRGVISNSSGSAQDVSLSITIPAGITVNDFYQVYRSNQSASSTTQPDDNMQQVYEANPTSGQITAKSITLIDIVPDSLRGAALYTNATQEGILQSNDQAPFCLDIALFQTCLFFANTKTTQQLLLSLISVGGASGIASGDVLTIAGVTYTGAAAENVATRQFKVFSSGSASQNIADTALSLVRVINRAALTTAVYAYYISGTSDLPGKMLIESRSVGAATFTVTASAHGSAFLPVLPVSGSSVISASTDNPNGLMFSKSSQPEAVPALNIMYVGSASKPIRRIIPTRNSLLILKDDGVFRCTGIPGNFSIDTIDSTIVILAPESAISLNNSCYFLTNQGVVSVNDNGGEVISRPIENQLVGLEGVSLDPLRYYSFGVSYESERQYMLWTPSNEGDTLGTQCFIFNTFTKTWTRSTRRQVFGLVLVADNRLYLLNQDSNAFSQERKAFTYADYTDETYPVTITAVGGGGQTLTLADASAVTKGDLIYLSASVNSTVDSVNYVTGVVTMLTVPTGWVTGAAFLLKSIACLVEWLPISAGNPGYIRQYREMAVVFKLNAFTNSTLNFYSDISTGIERVPIIGSGSGAWGRFPWGSIPWGGLLRSRPFRTYVPREKQRCDLLSTQFQCKEAWSNFQIEGIVSTFHSIGERVAS